MRYIWAFLILLGLILTGIVLVGALGLSLIMVGNKYGYVAEIVVLVIIVLGFIYAGILNIMK